MLLPTAPPARARPPAAHISNVLRAANRSRGGEQTERNSRSNAPQVFDKFQAALKKGAAVPKTAKQMAMKRGLHLR